MSSMIAGKKDFLSDGAVVGRLSLSPRCHEGQCCTGVP